jgi:hypothetical protein
MAPTSALHNASLLLMFVGGIHHRNTSCLLLFAVQNISKYQGDPEVMKVRQQGDTVMTAR